MCLTQQRSAQRLNFLSLIYTLWFRCEQIDTRIVNLRTDVASANEALRRRVATLEHQVQELQDRVQQ